MKIAKKKKKKYLGINLITHIQDLNAENYKMLIKTFKDLVKWRYTMPLCWKTL